MSPIFGGWRQWCGWAEPLAGALIAAVAGPGAAAAAVAGVGAHQLMRRGVAGVVVTVSAALLARAGLQGSAAVAVLVAPALTLGLAASLTGRLIDRAFAGLVAAALPVVLAMELAGWPEAAAWAPIAFGAGVGLLAAGTRLTGADRVAAAVTVAALPLLAVAGVAGPVLPLTSVVLGLVALVAWAPVPPRERMAAQRDRDARAAGSDERRASTFHLGELTRRSGVYPIELTVVGEALQAVTVDAGLTRALGLAEASLDEPQAWWAGVHPGDMARLGAALAGAAHEAALPDALAVEFRLASAAGEWRWLLLRAGAQPVADGVRFSGLLLDVTEVKEAHQRLIQTSKLALLGELVSGVTHELNQPLNVIRLAAHNADAQLQREAPDWTQVGAKIARIREQVTRAARITANMRLLARRPDAQRAEFSLAECIETVREMLAAQLAQHGIELEVDAADPSPVRGDPQMLEQVLINLVVNARDAIRTRCRDHPEPPGVIHLVVGRGGGEEVRLYVRDNGGGVPDAIRQRIFDAFFTTKPAGEGTGLGLAICRGILADMGGAISVRNVSAGAEFCVRLPTADEGHHSLRNGAVSANDASAAGR